MAKVTKKWVSECVRKLPDSVDVYQGDGVELKILGLFNDDWTEVGLHVRGVRVAPIIGSALKTKQSPDDNRVILFECHLPYKNFYPNGKRLTYQDLETILYSYFNKMVEEAIKQYKKEDGGQETPQLSDIYVAVSGYNSTRASFYLKWRETDKTIWLIPLSKVMYSSEDDPQNGRVVPYTQTINVDDVIRRSKKDGNGVRINDYKTAYPWDGKPVQEYSD